MKRLEKYTLTWHNYSDHLREALQEMLSTSDFADVTLVTDDKQQIRAHRSILSTCSPVFKNILHLSHDNANPVIYLRGIQHSEMESIMQFIYLGEARFYEERMSEFLQVSRDLEIKDLSTGIRMKDQTDSNDESSEHQSNADEDVGDDSALTRKKDDNVEYQTQTHTSKRPIIRNNEANKKVRRTDGDIKYDCIQCDKQYTDLSSLTTHIRSKHEGIKYACNQCDKQYTDRSSLRKHIQSAHETVKYTCNQCDYQARYPSHLTNHLQKRKHL